MTGRQLYWQRFMRRARWRLAFVALTYIAWLLLPHPYDSLTLILRMPTSFLLGMALARYCDDYRDICILERWLRIQGFFDD